MPPARAEPVAVVLARRARKGSSWKRTYDMAEIGRETPVMLGAHLIIPDVVVRAHTLRNGTRERERDLLDSLPTHTQCPPPSLL